MEALSGRRLTALSAVLSVLCLAAALGILAAGGPPAGAAPPRREPAGAASAPERAASAPELAARARAAEAAGDVAAALALYRAAAAADPSCLDRRSPAFLGEAFAGKLRGWIEALRSGRLPGGAPALKDASYLFRRMYGGCG